MRLDRSFQENLGKYNFTARWKNIQDTTKRMPFYRNRVMILKQNLFVTRLKQFRTNENSLDYRLQTVIRKEVQAKKSVR